jgi:hypothetical protein
MSVSSQGVSTVRPGNTDEMNRFTIDDGPTFVEDADDAPLPGHHEARFRSPDGATLTRYLTDKGRAHLLRVMERRRYLTGDELDEHTVEADMDELLARMDREAGEGA